MVKLVEMSLKIATVLCVYLVLSISTASAVELSIYRQIMTGGTPSPTGEKIDITLDHSDKIDKGFEFVHDEKTDPRWEKVQVKIEVIGNDPLYPISKIYLFRCKDSLPLDCVDYEPVEADSFLSGEKGTFDWSDVSRGTKANFLTLVKFTHEGKDSWIGYWDEAARSGVQNFEHVSDSHNYELSYINLYAEPGVEPLWIKSFIEDHGMIPANWVEKSVFGPIGGNPVSEMYELVADGIEMNALSFGRYKPSGNIVTAIVKEYLMAFAKGSIANPVTFFVNELPACGDGECEVGEDPSNCCLDCWCPSESQECSSNDNFPDGLCHVCGDGVRDPVENSTNCCVDTECPGGLYCDPGMNIPYGQCVTPECGNDVCEPAEDSGTCPGDCWNTPGKTCSDVFGTGYYYNEITKACVLASCDGESCEPGEDYSNCCLDCGCPSGQYCDTETFASGVCTLPTCRNTECEQDEEYGGDAACCTDCNDCPADPNTGQLQVCTSNVCHLCGNGIIESPVETEETCCQDTGCLQGYCSVSGSCRDADDMGMRVTILPSTLDCTQTDSDVDVKFTLINGPAFIESFKSVTYMYENGRYSLSNCQQQGETYLCKFPISGPHTFQGCFDEGFKDLNFNVVLTYFEDDNGKKSNDIKYQELEADLHVEVTKARLRSCNKDGTCDFGAGESPDYCCWDCMCEDGLICTASGCIAESQISLAINPDDLPNRRNIDCSPSGSGPAGEFTFMAHIQNVPEHAQERFRLLNWKLMYDGDTYTAQNIPGFTCTALTTEYGHHTGDIECKMHVSMFPACPDIPQPSVELFSLELSVLGGGLSVHYPIYEGKPVSDGFSLDYVQGLPLCGNGEPNPELGEVMEPEVTCCQDTGCLSGDVCTINAGCVARNLIDLDVKIDPSTVDCSPESADRRGTKQVRITATAPYKPYSPETGGLEFGDSFLDDRRVGGELYGVCTPLVNSTSYSVYSWECSIPVSEFNPFCWEERAYNVDFETDIAWFDRAGNRESQTVIKPVTFNVNPARQRQCIISGSCDAAYGEVAGGPDGDPRGCCADCGCTAGPNGEEYICAIGNICRNKDDIGMAVTVASPKLNCQAGSGDNDDTGELVLDVHMVNMPYHVRLIKWFMDYNSETFTVPYFTCEQQLDEVDNQPTGDYTCRMPVYNFPGCEDRDDYTVSGLNLRAVMIYEDYNGNGDRAELEDSFSVDVYQGGLPQCGNGRCDRNLNENEQNCCQDCQCTNDDDICLESGECFPENEITLTIKTSQVSTSCYMSPGNLGDIHASGDDYAKFSGNAESGKFNWLPFHNKWGSVIKDYGCMFDETIEVDIEVDPIPHVASVSTATFLWDKGDAKTDADEKPRPYYVEKWEPAADGWKLFMRLNQDNSLVLGPTTRNSVPKTSYIENVTLTIQTVTLHGGDKVITLKSDERDRVTVNFNAIKADDLQDYEETLKNIQKSVKKANSIACGVTTFLGICVICSMMAGNTTGTTEKDISEIEKLKKERDDMLEKVDETYKNGYENGELMTKERYDFLRNEINEEFQRKSDGILNPGGSDLEDRVPAPEEIGRLEMEKIDSDYAYKNQLAEMQFSGTAPEIAQARYQQYVSNGGKKMFGDWYAEDYLPPSMLAGIYTQSPTIDATTLYVDYTTSSGERWNQDLQNEWSAYNMYNHEADRLTYGEWYTQIHLGRAKAPNEIAGVVYTSFSPIESTLKTSGSFSTAEVRTLQINYILSTFEGKMQGYKSRLKVYTSVLNDEFMGIRAMVPGISWDWEYHYFSSVQEVDEFHVILKGVTGNVVAAPITGMQTWGNIAGQPAYSRSRMMMPAGGLFGGIPMGMFSNMMESMKGTSEKGAATAGYLAMGLFLVAEWTILKCEPWFWGALGGATLMCRSMLKNSPQTLRSWVKTCDVIQSLMGLLQMITNMQSGTLTYQACMMSAQAALTSRSGAQETGYDAAMRTSQYYNQLQQCQAGMMNTMDTMTYDMAMYSQQMQMMNAQQGGWTSPSVTADPPCEDGTGEECVIGPGGASNQFVISYSAPPMGSPLSGMNMGYDRSAYDPYYRGTSSGSYPRSPYLFQNYYGRNTHNSYFSGSTGSGYGQISIAFSYELYVDERMEYDYTITRDFRIRANQGVIRCHAHKNYIKCVDGGTGDIKTFTPFWRGHEGTAVMEGDVVVSSYMYGQAYPVAHYRFKSEGAVDVNQVPDEEGECGAFSIHCDECVNAQGCKFIWGDDKPTGCVDESVTESGVNTYTTEWGCMEWFNTDYQDWLDSGGFWDDSGDEPPAGGAKCSDYSGSGKCELCKAALTGSCMFKRSTNTCLTLTTAANTDDNLVKAGESCAAPVNTPSVQIISPANYAAFEKCADSSSEIEISGKVNNADNANSPNIQIWHYHNGVSQPNPGSIEPYWFTNYVYRDNPSSDWVEKIITRNLQLNPDGTFAATYRPNTFCNFVSPTREYIPKDPIGGWDVLIVVVDVEYQGQKFYDTSRINVKP